MATSVQSADGVSRTLTVTSTPPAGERLVLRLRKPRSDKKVSWEEEVVDNEFMGKKSSKCCCIYTKSKRAGDDSDDSSDDESWDDCCHEHRMAGKKLPHKH